jgi:hypothetical protein
MDSTDAAMSIRINDAQPWNHSIDPHRSLAPNSLRCATARGSRVDVRGATLAGGPALQAGLGCRTTGAAPPPCAELALDAARPSRPAGSGLRRVHVWLRPADTRAPLRRPGACVIGGRGVLGLEVPPAALPSRSGPGVWHTRAGRH